MSPAPTRPASRGSRARLSAAHLDALAADLRAASGTFEEATQLTEQFAAHVACIADEELLPGRDYKLKLAGREITASLTAIKYRLDVDRLHRLPARTLGRGEIGVCTIATQAPVALASDDDAPGAGRFIISDMHSDTPRSRSAPSTSPYGAA